MLASEQHWIHELKVLSPVWLLCETVRTGILVHQTHSHVSRDGISLHLLSNIAVVRRLPCRMWSQSEQALRNSLLQLRYTCCAATNLLHALIPMLPLSRAGESCRDTSGG